MSETEQEQILETARSLNQRGQYAQTILLLSPWYQSDDTSLAEQLSPENVLRALIMLSSAMHLQGKVSEALACAERAVKDSRSLASESSRKWLAKSLRVVGTCHGTLANYDLALSALTQALEITESISAAADSAHCLGDIATIYRDMGDYPKAIRHFQQAMDIDKSLDHQVGISMWSNGIGVVYQLLGDFDKALEYFQESLRIAEIDGATPRIAAALGNVGAVYFGQKDYAKALEIARQALSLDEQTGNAAGIARHTGNIGQLYYALNEFDAALEHLQRALDLDQQLGNAANVAVWTGLIGSVYAHEENGMNDDSKAEEYIVRSIDLGEALGYKAFVSEARFALSQLYERQQRWQEYAKQFRQFYDLEKELRSNETAQQTRLLEHRRKVEESERDRQIHLARFQEQERILHGILPPKIAERVVAGERRIVEQYDNVSVMFADIVGFSGYAQEVSVHELADLLDEVFNIFDRLADTHGCEKIKTIGDCYMAVAGLPEKSEDHALRLAAMSLDMLSSLHSFRDARNKQIHIRIGLHCGSVVAGILGKNKYAYDLWGDAVNTASRMESHGEAGKIHVSQDFQSLVHSTQTQTNAEPAFRFAERGEIDIKGKGLMRTYFLESV